MTADRRRGHWEWRPAENSQGDVPPSAHAVEAVWIDDQPADTVACDHPPDAIGWNPWNRVTQCHRCGQVMDRTPMPSEDAVRYPGEGSGA